MSFLEPEVEPSPPRALLIARMVASAVAARWRAMVLAFLLFVTIWLASQVFLFARSAYWYIHDNLPKLDESYKQIPSVHDLPTDLLTIAPPITNCWRDRALAGDCFNRRGAGPQSPPLHLRSPGLPPRHRFQCCRPDDI